MRAIVTGATSFLGISVCKNLLAKGFEVYAVVRKTSENLSRLPVHADLHHVYCDLSDLTNLAGQIESADYFFHLGWSGVGSKGRSDRTIQDGNIRNALHAVRMAHRLQVRCFVEAGSQAEYGFTEGLITEETPCHPVTEYGKAKLRVYEEGGLLANGLGIKYLHLRIFSVYGEYDHDWTLISSSLRKMLQGEEVSLSACTQNWNYLYVEDAAEQIVRLCRYADEDEGFRAEVFHVASEDTRPLSGFIDEMVRLTGTTSRIKKETASERLLSLSPSVEKTKKAIRFIGDYSFEKGIKSMIRYLKRKCILCGGHLYDEPLMELKNMPASAQDIPSDSEVADDKGISMSLYQCADCGLVQFDTDPVRYYRDVIRAGGASSTMVDLRKAQYTGFIERFGLKGKKIVEIGCGQGEFLSVLAEFDVHACGIEHSGKLVEVARNKGLEVFEMFAENRDSVIPGGPYDGFVQFNFLEHQPYPNEMLQGIYRNLTDDGVGLVTVPSLEYILQHNGYYELIRDHIAYYSEETLRFLFEKNGFELVECTTVNRDTHSIWVKKRKRVDVRNWAESFKVLKSELHACVDAVSARGGKVAVWGASHQGFTVIPTLDLSSKISYIIDSAPFKQGKFAPASHVPIVSPDYFSVCPVEAIVIMAPGYTDEIARIIRERLSATVAIYALRTTHLEKID